jgi:hypothetical protein
MSTELSFVKAVKEGKRPIKHFMEDYDDRYGKLWIFRRI